MIESLTKYNWGNGSYEKEQLPGTEDWVEAFSTNLGDGYDWRIFNAYWSPSARRYFWHGDSGCSCNSWDEGVSNAASFEDGDKESLLRGWERFCEGYWVSDADRHDGAARLRALEVPEA